MAGNEKRRRVRIQYQADVTVIGPNGTLTNLHTRDINLRGLFIETQEKWNKGAPVDIILDLSGDSNEKPLSIKGEIARVTPDGMGIAFSALEMDDFFNLQQFVSRHRKTIEGGS
ncbi:MAG: PilZ domain-containing protein [Deltaproteobacteria bacterium]|nr:PilZ domain-containing protein [Deltaproteobacteria bacterium]MBW2053410.1 PilZ domain-containing protein [Deltaproteobacteria bacterium]MBW2142279.1 PilZ domain-containing protein [Deltaproteobacteria bacterium]MBW2324518.1 PilZ domain-containing protein [Deltaproteobacteria bacterium]